MDEIHREKIWFGNCCFPGNIKSHTSLHSYLCLWEISKYLPFCSEKKGPSVMYQRGCTDAFSQLWSLYTVLEHTQLVATWRQSTLWYCWLCFMCGHRADFCTQWVHSLTYTHDQSSLRSQSQPYNCKEALLKPSLPFSFSCSGFLLCTNTCM